MSRDVRAFVVFLSSPSDVPAERAVAQRVRDRVNAGYARQRGRLIDLVLWEDLPPAYGRPQDRLDDLVDQCDLFIGLLHERWGTATGEYTSGFEEEFARARARHDAIGSPDISIYFKLPPEASRVDPKVLHFREAIGQTLTYGLIGSAGDWDLELAVLFQNLVTDGPSRDPELLRAEVRRVVRALPERTKLVLSLLNDEGLAPGEVADVLGLPIERVTALIAEWEHQVMQSLGFAPDALPWLFRRPPHSEG